MSHMNKKTRSIRFLKRLIYYESYEGLGLEISARDKGKELGLGLGIRVMDYG